MRFRKLRIAFSAVCGILCLLLIALWVRSYWWCDIVNIDAPEPWAIQFQSMEGIFAASIYESSQSWDWLSLKPVFVPGLHQIVDQVGLWKFSLYEINDTNVATVPCWFVIAAISAAGILPWFPLRRFSLRTLLIAMSLIVVILGTIVIAARK